MITPFKIAESTTLSTNWCSWG